MVNFKYPSVYFNHLTHFYNGSHIKNCIRWIIGCNIQTRRDFVWIYCSITLTLRWRNFLITCLLRCFLYWWPKKWKCPKLSSFHWHSRMLDFYLIYVYSLLKPLFFFQTCQCIFVRAIEARNPGFGFSKFLRFSTNVKNHS